MSIRWSGMFFKPQMHFVKMIEKIYDSDTPPVMVIFITINSVSEM